MKNCVHVLILFCISCNPKKPNQVLPLILEHQKNDSNNYYSKLGSYSKKLNKDTIIKFSISGLSSEGSEADVQYVNDSIRSVYWNIYGETGKIIIKYLFSKKGIVQVYEKNYAYITDLNSAKTEKDFILKYSLRYEIDTNGIILSKVNHKVTNVFNDFKSKVPFVYSK